ncbi:MAG: hypothetical protein ABSC08_00480 [Bryobacteraceae bacterium]
MKNWTNWAVDHDPETRADGELSEEQESEVSGGTGSQSSGAGAGKVTFNPF